MKDSPGLTCEHVKIRAKLRHQLYRIHVNTEGIKQNTQIYCLIYLYVSTLRSYTSLSPSHKYHKMFMVITSQYTYKQVFWLPSEIELIPTKNTESIANIFAIVFLFYIWHLSFQCTRSTVLAATMLRRDRAPLSIPFCPLCFV